MKGKNREIKWTKKLKAVIISLCLAFAVALGGACAAIGLSLSDNNKLGGYSAGGVADEITTPAVPEADETFYAGVTVGETTYSTNAEAWAAAVEYSITNNAVVQFDLTRSWTGVSATGFGTATETNSPFGAAGALSVPAGAKIILNISKNVKLNRNVGETAIDNGSVISVTGGTLYVTGEGTITGGNTTGTGGGIYVKSGSTLEIYGNTISGNNAYEGGGIYVVGSLKIAGGKIANNQAAGGGGIYTTGTLTITGGEISGNTVSEAGGGIWIASTEEAEISECTITENTADTFGGGIGVIDTASLKMSDSEISHNKAGSDGGGIASNGVLNLTGCEISYNSTGRAGGGLIQHISTKIGSSTFTDVDFKNNTAVTNGGAIALQSNIAINALNIVGGTISGNTANGNGGGIAATEADTIIELSGVEISGNTASSYGGGIYSSGDLIIKSGTVTGNKGGNGGGIWAVGGKVNIGVEDDNTKITNVSNNTSTVSGAGVYVSGAAITECKIYNAKINYNSSAADAGGLCCVFIPTTVKIEVKGCEISGNTAVANGGGGGVHLNGGTMEISDCRIEQNVVEGRGAGLNLYSGTMTVSGNTVISGNVAGSAGGGVDIRAGTSFKLEGKSATEKIKITGNTSLTSSGGGIYQGSGTAEIINCAFEDNKAGQVGAGIFVAAKTILTDCTFTGNQAADGAGIYLNNGNVNVLEMTDVTVTGNRATKYGGAMTAGRSTEVALDGKIDISGNTSGGVTDNVLFNSLGVNFHVAEGGSITAGSKIGVNPHKYTMEDATNVFFTGAKPTTLTLSPDNPDYYEISTTGTETKVVLKSDVSNDPTVRWNKAVNDSLAAYDKNNTDPNHNQVKFELFDNWTANASYSFGVDPDAGDAPDASGNNEKRSFANGGLLVPENANIVLDIRTFDINKGVPAGTTSPTVMIAVYGTLTITGDGKITGARTGGDGAAIYIGSHGTLNMYGGSITGNAAARGAAIWVAGGTFNMYGGQISNNTSVISGGAIQLSSTSKFNMYGGTISGNKNTEQNQWGGGGIYVQGKCTFNVYGGTISGNTTAGHGGGIFSETESIVNIGKKAEDGTLSGDAIISGNHATNTVVGAVYSYGGGIYAVGTLNLYSGTIKGNDAKTGGGGVSASVSCTFDMYGGEISGNTANYGGGVFVSNASSLTMTGGKIKGNTSVNSHGGGVCLDGTLNMTGGEISGNTSKSYGGGVFVQANGTFNLGSVTGTGANAVYSGTGKIINNKADDGDDETENLGGGVFVNFTDNKVGKFNLYSGEISGNSALRGGGVAVWPLASFEMFGGKISGNTATGDGGGGIFFGDTKVTAASETKTFIKIHGGEISGNTSGGSGGGISFWSNGGLTMDGGEIKNNKAAGKGGGVAFGNYSTGNLSGKAQIKNNTAAWGGGFGIWISSQLTIDGENVKIDGNTSAGTGGGIYVNAGGSLILEKGTISGNTSVSDGGGIYNCGSFVMNDGLITKNNALSGGGVSGSGTDAIIELYGGTITENVAKGNGGGVGITCSATIDGVTISRNSAGLGGGFNNWGDGIIEFKSGTITENWSGTGGGISIYQPDDTRYDYSKLIISGDAVISGNDAETVGGGVYVRGKLEMSEDAVISGNSAENGGGVYVYTGATFTMSGGVIGGETKEEGNTANYGGGVYVAGTLTLSESGQIKNNNASDSGGGVFVNESVMNMSGGTISGNSANSGGGVLFYGDRPTNRGTGNFSGGTVSGNTANRYGGGVWVWKDTKFNVSGSPVITGNTRTDGTVDNTYLNSAEAWITVSGVLTNNARIGVTNVGNQLRTVTKDFGSKNSSNADTLARNVFKADKEGQVAVLDSGEVVLKEGKVLTVNDSNNNKLGTITTVSGAKVTGALDANDSTGRTYTLTELFNGNATSNALTLSLDEDLIPAGYVAYMYLTPTATEEVSEVTVSENRSVYIDKKAIDVDYKIIYKVQLANGTYTTYEKVKQGLTGTSVVVDFATDLAQEVSTPEQYSIDGATPTDLIKGDGSTEVEVYLKLNKYKVSFTDGGTTLLASKEYFYGETITADTDGIKVVGVNNPSKALNTFVGWYTDAELEHSLFESGDVTVRTDMTIYAKFDTQKFDLTFDLNLGTGANQLDLDRVLEHTGANMYEETTGKGGKVTWDYDSLFNSTFDFTVGANAEKGLCTIKYDVNNISRFGLSLSGITPSAIGYKFDGWYVGNSKRTVINQPTNPDTQPITLTAHWSLDSYTITFNKMDRTTAAASTTQKVTNVQNLSLWSGILPATPLRSDGQVFLGWYRTEADAKAAATNTAIRDIYYWSSIREKDDETLWASTAKFSISDFGYFSEGGVTFDKYGNGTTTEYDFSKLTLYAAWKSIDVYVSVDQTIEHGELDFEVYDSATDKWNSANDKAVKIGDTIRVTATPAPGYVLSNVTVGSTNKSTLTPTKTDPTTVTFTVNSRYLRQDVVNVDKRYVDVTAQFAERAFTITYRYDGGARDREDSGYSRTYTVSQLDNEEVILPCMVTKLGYNFRGWKFVKDEEVIEDNAFFMDEMGKEGDLYGENMWLVSPLEISDLGEYDNVILVAQWKPQPSYVYLYNAAYDLLDEDPRVQGYEYANNRYTISGVETAETIEIVNPMRASFIFLGWGTTNNGVVVYPVAEDTDFIEYKVDAHADRSGNELNRNRLYAVWQVEGVDYIIMSATNNNSTYSNKGIEMVARPAQNYSAGDGAKISITYKWYKVFDGMYDNCFIEKPFVDEDDYMIYVDDNGNPVAYEKDGQYYGVTDGSVDTAKSLTAEEVEALGTKLTYKEFNPAQAGVSCVEMFSHTKTINNNSKVDDSVTIRDVKDCGIYICDVRVSASVGEIGTIAGGYGEIEISMKKAEFGGATLSDVNVQYDSTSKAGNVKLTVEGATYNYETGYLVMPDTVDTFDKTRRGTTMIVTYKFYQGEGNDRVEIAEPKAAGTYTVEVSFEFLAGGDNGNYELIDTISAELVITPYTIGNIGSAFIHNDAELGGTAPYHGTYDGDAYTVNLSIRDKIELSGGSTVDVAKDGVQLEVNTYKETSNGWISVTAGTPTVDAGNYYVEIVGLRGLGKDNYELGSMNTLRYSYTIDKKAFDIELGWVGDKTVAFDNVAHTLTVEEEKLPAIIKVSYSTVYTAYTAGYDAAHPANGGVDAGTYVITATFDFRDEADANNYEKLPDMTETLTIEKTDLLEYFKDKYGEDLLIGGNFVNASYAYKTGEKHNPHVESGSLTTTTNFALTYEYYLCNDEGGRTLIGSGTHSELVEKGNLISEAGTYEVVLRIAYVNARYSNDFKEVDEKDSTVTCLIEAGTVASVTVNWKADASAWASGTAMTVNLGDGFDYNWIDTIDVMYVGSTEAKVISGDAIKLAVIDFDPANPGRASQTTFWHIGEFNLGVSYYGTSCNNKFTVYQAIDEVTVKYCVKGGTYAPVPDNGIVYRSENDYVFQISYSGTNKNGDVVDVTTNATVDTNSGVLVLGNKNTLKPKANEGETLYYTFGKIAVNVYKVVASGAITWQYRAKGSSGEWSDISKNTYSIDYAGVEFEVRAMFAGEGSDGAQVVSGTVANDLVLRNYRANGYSLKFGITENGKYLVEDQPVIHIAKLQLTLKWDYESLVYNGGRAIAPKVIAPDAGAFITEADTGLVTFKYSFKTAGGTNVGSMTNVGSYVVTAELDSESEYAALLNNYAISANAEHDFAITPADIDMTVVYSESTYGTNRTYEGNSELRISALQKNFNGGTVVNGDFEFITELADTYSDSLKTDGVTLARNLLKVDIPEEEESTTVTVYYAYIPVSANYKVAMGSITLTVLKQTASTGKGALSLVLGEGATRKYVKGQPINTENIYVYRLYQSAYQEGNKWYGKIEDITDGPQKISFWVGEWDTEVYRIRDIDVTNGYVEIKAVAGNDTGTIQIPVIEKIPSALDITEGVTFKTVYYVGEKFNFSDIDFTVTFPGDGSSDEKQSGFRYGDGITSDVSELTDGNGRFTTAGTYTVTFSFFDATPCTAEFEIRAKETLTAEWAVKSPTLVLKDGSVVTQPTLTFKKADGTTVNITDSDITYIIRVFRGDSELGGLENITQTGKNYELVFVFTVLNPAYNDMENYSVTSVTVTENPYSATVTLPENLSAVYTGNGITIPKPSISNVINTSTGAAVTRYTVVYTIDGEEVSLTSDKWSQTEYGTYKIDIEVRIDDTDFSAILNIYSYSFGITKADNTAEISGPTLVILGKTQFDFNLTAKFGKTDAVWEYWNESVGWTSGVPAIAGMWKVRVTIPDTPNYGEVSDEFEFEVRNPDATVANGSIAGGNGVGDGWTLVITQMEAEAVGKVSISSQNVLDGYKVEFKKVGGAVVSGEGTYTVSIKLSDELKGKSGLKIFYKNAEGKTKELKATVKDGSISFATSEFDGEFIIATAVAKASVGPLVAVIILGVIAAAAIALCIIVFLKKRKRGAD